MSGSLTVFARIPPKLAVSYPNSMSPTSKEKHEKMRIGDIEAMLPRRFVMLMVGFLSSLKGSIKDVQGYGLKDLYYSGVIRGYPLRPERAI